MLPKLLCMSLLILAVEDVAATIGLIDINMYNRVYYDPVTRLGLKGELEDAGRFPLSQAKISYRGMSCVCEGLTCGCCVGVNITILNFDHRTCTNFTYIPNDFAIKVAISMNERVIFTNSLSAKNPPPLCAPFPYFPLVHFCVRFFDVYTPDRNLHACIDFETRVANWPVLVLHFNCIKIGLDGVAWTKPEDGSSVLQMKPEVSGPEIYDEVNFEPDSALPSNHTSTLTTEQENIIGQLKL